ncbi:MAG: phosphonate ABC transporter ATP-binding protein [Desulfobacteraceae bacterium]|jgi:phosphonate transport system ATP-binding protein|nr:MAG: phosphonate ABC transporter ATP-binding protein [Desulfobacteraceae bacterium]
MSNHQTVPAAIEVETVSKTFGKRQALRRLSLRVEPGEMVALIGPSGSGKSTLLRHVSGLVAGDRDSGPIRIFGQEVQKNGFIRPDIRRIRSEMGFIFQQFNLVERLPLLTNVMTGMLARISTLRSIGGYFTREEKLRAMRALHTVGLAEYAAQRAGTLSGGQQQRAAIARAIEQRARIILADEPIASLDPESARMVMDCLTALNRKDGVTVVVSLHQVQFALQYCPRSIALKEGRIVYDGPSAGLCNAMLCNIYDTRASGFDMDGTVPLGLDGYKPPAAVGVSAAAA